MFVMCIQALAQQHADTHVRGYSKTTTHASGRTTNSHRVAWVQALSFTLEKCSVIQGLEWNGAQLSLHRHPTQVWCQ